jgi:hypothetical protein
MADDVTKKLDELRRLATERLHDARAIVAQMNTVETLFDLPLTALSDLETSALGTPSVPAPSLLGGPSAEPRSPSQPQARRISSAIRPDEYFGDEPMEAAKKYIRGVGHAVHFDEITDAVQKGGAAIRGADWRERLETSLKRSPYQVITVADKTYGLAEFYTEEQLKRFRDTRRSSQSEPSAKKKSKAKPKPKAVARKVEPTKTTTKPKKNAEPATVTTIVEAPKASDTGSASSEPIH